jgi:hypothetical protein
MYSLAFFDVNGLFRQSERCGLSSKTGSTANRVPAHTTSCGFNKEFGSSGLVGGCSPTSGLGIILIGAVAPRWRHQTRSSSHVSVWRSSWWIAWSWGRGPFGVELVLRQ